MGHWLGILKSIGITVVLTLLIAGKYIFLPILRLAMLETFFFHFMYLIFVYVRHTAYNIIMRFLLTQLLFIISAAAYAT